MNHQSGSPARRHTLKGKSCTALTRCKPWTRTSYMFITLVSAERPASVFKCIPGRTVRRIYMYTNYICYLPSTGSPYDLLSFHGITSNIWIFIYNYFIGRRNLICSKKISEKCSAGHRLEIL